jgi:uncharacterized membrane protein YqhA
MQKLIEKSRYLALLAVLSLLITASLTFVLGALKTWQAGVKIVMSKGQDPLILIYLLQIMDVFLVATVLFVFAASLYEMFIGRLDLPDWASAHSLAELKVKLGGALILVMAVTFLEHLMEWRNPQETLLFAIAIAVVAAILIALGKNEKPS